MKINCITAALLVTLCAGCSQEDEKTQSMIRRDTASAESQEIVAKAQTLTSSTTFSQPAEHLDELVIIQELLRDARKVYKDARILNWHDPELTKLEENLKSVNKPLALYSLDAFELAIDKSLAFKQKKTDVESLPVYDNTLAKQALYTHLETFNQDLEDCCIDKILLINRFLRTEENKYYDVIKMGHNTLHYMGMLIRGEISEEALRNKVVSQRDVIEAQK